MARIYLQKQKLLLQTLICLKIIIPNCVGVNVLNENDADGDGSDDFSIVIKTPSGDVGDVILYSFKRGAWRQNLMSSSTKQC